MNCIECGLCDRACPSQIPLAHIFAEAKDIEATLELEDKAKQHYKKSLPRPLGAHRQRRANILEQTRATTQKCRTVVVRTPHVMTWVLVALLPGLGAMTYVWGIGIVYNVALLSIICLATEAAAVFAKQALGNAPGENTVKKWSGHLFDGSTLVTAWLIAICLPPFTNFGILSLAGLAAIGLAKHAYGGLGRNIFNPAMVGYAVILVSFPSHLALWPASSDGGIDHLTGATILSDFRYRVGITTTEFTSLFAPNLQDQRLIAYSFLAGVYFYWSKNYSRGGYR